MFGFGDDTTVAAPGCWEGAGGKWGGKSNIQYTEVEADSWNNPHAKVCAHVGFSDYGDLLLTRLFFVFP